MQFNDYQKHAVRTLNMDQALTRNERISNMLLGLVGEAGETADYTKKVLYHGHRFDPNHLAKELGDQLWYIAAVAHIFGLELDAIAAMNVEKLKQRYPEGFTTQHSVAREDANESQ